MTRLLLLPCAALIAASPATAEQSRDLYDHLVEVNRASIVMLSSRGLVAPDQAARIAAGIRTYADEQSVAGAPRPPAYNRLEQRLAQIVGPEASNLHLGRSNNDINETVNRLVMREALLELVVEIGAVRTRLHHLASENLETVMPGFTHAVQAQPTTLAHFLLAFDASLARDSARLREAYARTNLCPLGAGAFTTSGFALDRPLLAELLGFPGLVENSYDAIMVSAADSKVELSATLGLSALNLGRFIQFIIFQYDDPVPGILLTGDIVGRSSIMPQKRNPSALERLRLRASEVVANGHAAALFVHNTPLYEVKDAREDHLERTQRFTTEAREMYELFGRVLDSLTIRPQTLRDQVDRDYATMTELADTLHRDAGVPFRTGYRVASELTTYGRERGKRPLELTHTEVADIYRKVTGGDLPLNEAQLRRAFDPLEIIRSRQGRGGPQPAETSRMLEAQRGDASATTAWITGERARLARASAELHRRFEALAGPR